MRILITGSSGFIAKHLSHELSAAGHLLAEFDIKDGHDATDYDAVALAIESARAEAVIHLAEAESTDGVLGYVRDNLAMTSVVAKACGELGARMIYGSGTEVYGFAGEKVADESHGPFGLPASLYGLSKSWGEQACQLLAPKGFTSLRFSLPYGPGMKVERSAVVDTLWRAQIGRTMPYFETMRSWCWIGDTARAARLAIERGEGMINIGRDDEYVKMSEMAEFACEITGASTSLLVMHAGEIEAPKRISTARIRNLGWIPTVGLREGMEQTWEDWVKYLDRKGEPVVEEVL